MSAFLPLATIERTSLEVRFVPNSDVAASRHRLRVCYEQTLAGGRRWSASCPRSGRNHALAFETITISTRAFEPISR